MADKVKEEEVVAPVTDALKDFSFVEEKDFPKVTKWIIKTLYIVCFPFYILRDNSNYF